MGRKWKLLSLGVLTAVLFCGCSLRTVDQMYHLPKRSKQFHNLQSVIDSVMDGKEFCAPISGDNQQTVQQADLDGDQIPEYLLFARSNCEKPLTIFIFRQQGDTFALAHTVECSGTAFDKVEYVQMDGSGGLELVVGKQVSNQLLRSMSVYRFSATGMEHLITTSYSFFLPVNIREDPNTELFVLQPGNQEADYGVAVIYGMDATGVNRSNEAPMSRPISNLKRVIAGKLHGGSQAVFVGSMVDESTIVTDVYAMVDAVLTNISRSGPSNAGVETLRNHYIYADDIDEDGEVELPDVNPLHLDLGEQKCLIRWYAMSPKGKMVDKMYTFHNFISGWYLRLHPKWAAKTVVVQEGNAYAFYSVQDGFAKAQRIFCVYAFTGEDREIQATSENRFVLYSGESTVYAAYLDVASATLGITKEDLVNGFRLIRRDWNTGET